MPTLTIKPFVNARPLGRCRYARTFYNKPNHNLNIMYYTFGGGVRNSRRNIDISFDISIKASSRSEAERKLDYFYYCPEYLRVDYCHEGSSAGAWEMPEGSQYGI